MPTHLDAPISPRLASHGVQRRPKEEAEATSRIHNHPLRKHETQATRCSATQPCGEDSVALSVANVLPC
jgi:hypothetical protein